MATKCKITLPKLISYVSSISEPKQQPPITTQIIQPVQPVQPIQTPQPQTIQSFDTLKFKDTKQIADMPQHIKTLFDPYISNIARYGVPIASQTKNIVSLIYSVFACVVSQNLSSNDYEILLKKIKDKLLSFALIDVNYRKYSTTYHINKYELANIVNTLCNETVMINLILDYFNINIFIADVAQDKIFVASSNPIFNMFKQNIFMSFHNNCYEPLLFNGTGICSYDSELVKKMVKINKALLVYKNHTSEFVVGFEDLECVAVKPDDKKRSKNKIPAVPKTETPQVNVQPDAPQPDALPETDEPTDDTNKPKLGAMLPKTLKLGTTLSKTLKLAEYQELATKHNITIYKTTDNKQKAKTRLELYDELANVILTK